MKKKKEREEKKHETSPVRHLQLELQKLRRELRTTARVYTQRLEHELIAATDALGRYAPAEKLTREQLHRVRDLPSWCGNGGCDPRRVAGRICEESTA